MTTRITSVSYEEAADMLSISQSLENTELGAATITLAQHPTMGLLLVTMTVEGTAAYCTM